DELGNGVARLLVGVGGPCRQLVGSTVDGGVLLRGELHQSVHHHLRLLGGGRVVEPDQRLAVDDLFQDREVRPHRVDVEHLVLVGQLRHWIVRGEEVIVALIAGRCVRHGPHSVGPPHFGNRGRTGWPRRRRTAGSYRNRGHTSGQHSRQGRDDAFGGHRKG